MVIISTSAVAEIIHAVSAASILAGCAMADVTMKVAPIAAMLIAAPVRANIPRVMHSPMQVVRQLQRVGIGLAGANTQRLTDVHDKNLTVADLTGFRRRS